MKRSGAGVVYLAKMFARAGIGAALVLSFFASLAPLAAAAVSGAGAMACCVGQQGHCNSGVSLKRRPQPAPEPMCGLRSSKSNDARIAGDETTVDRITVVAISSEAAAAPDNSVPAFLFRTSSKVSDTPALGASMARPCPVGCCTGTTGIFRQPRPREVSLLTSGSDAVHPPRHFIRIPLTTTSAASAYLLRSRPRGPPSASC